MKGIDFTGKNALEIVGEELGTTLTWEQSREVFTTVHYVSGIDNFDTFFGEVKFSETEAILKICSCSKAILFILEYKNKRNIFGIYRSQIRNVIIEKDVDICVRSINRITKTLKGMMPVIPFLAGTIADNFVKIQPRTVKGSVFNLLVTDENNQECKIVFSSTNENIHNLATEEFVKKHLNSSVPKKDKEGCYIATVCYGSYEAPEVIAFRKYRDIVLKKSFIGRLIIKLYYSFSPTIANLLVKRPIPNRFIKKYILNFIYSRINKK